MTRANRLWAVALAIPVALVPLAGLAGETDVAGTWTKSGVLQSGETVVTTLVLKQDGENVAGTWHSTGVKPETIREGRMSKDQLTFQIESAKPGGLVKAFYSGTIRGDTMELAAEVHLRGKIVKPQNTLKLQRAAR